MYGKLGNKIQDSINQNYSTVNGQTIQQSLQTCWQN